jgi:hypothetical protein
MNETCFCDRAGAAAPKLTFLGHVLTRTGHRKPMRRAEYGTPPRLQDLDRIGLSAGVRHES